jgi:tripartite-type tricarboxylate transporter receptor subunit TctC
MGKRIFCYAVIASLSLFFCSPVVLAAEKYPSREIQLIIPNPPGGFVDIAVRLMSDNLAKILGVPIVINNRAGAGGASGTNVLVNSKPDGYTMGAVSSADVVLIPAILPSVPFKYSDMDPVCKFATSPNVVFCKADAPWKTIEDLVADAKKRPGKITYGATTQSISYFQMEGFMAAAGFNMLHVPLQAAGQTITRILGGNLDIGIASVAPLAGQFKAGALRPLLLMAPERIREYSQLPTPRDKGYQNPIIDLYTGFLLPLGTPKPIKDVLEKALEKAIVKGQAGGRLAGTGLSSLGSLCEGN